jgi:carboxypeptidase PM20D1
MRTLILLALLALTANAPAQDKSSDYTQPWQVKAHEVLKASIPFRTARSHGQVPALADYLARQFLDGGFAAEDVFVFPVQSDGEDVASLVVRYRGDESLNTKPVLFLAHMDVVDAVAEDWDTNPFELVEKDGFFAGRGVIDDKLGTSIYTALFIRLRNEGYVPGRDLIVAFTGDEETASDTISDLLNNHRDLIDADFAFNLDGGGGVLDENFKPIGFYLKSAEKNYANFQLTARNLGGHSSRPRPDNAIYDLADGIKAIQQLEFPLRSNAITREYFALTADIRGGEVGEAMRQFAADPTNAEAAAIISINPALAGFLRTTCIPTMLTGGHVENALPQSASVNINCRIFPGVGLDEVRAKLQAALGDLDLELTTNSEPEVSPATPIREDVYAAVRKAVENEHPGTPVMPSMSTGISNASTTRRAGIPTYMSYGLFIREQDDFTHGRNERIAVSSFFAALDHWYIVTKEVSKRN